MNRIEDKWAIQTKGLTKEFGGNRGWRFWTNPRPIKAVNQISLQVRRGDFFGLLGPNGAGKTTLVKMLCTLILPTSGQAEVLGYPLSAGQEIRRRVGLTVTDERSFYWRLTGRQNLTFFASLHGLFGADAQYKVDELLQAVQLASAADRPFRGYSTGMKQRLAIARALLADPELLVLDEPTRSLDPVATQRLHELITTLRSERGMTVFLITHDLAEAEKLCRQVAIMHRGQILALDRPAGIRARLAQKIRYHLTLSRIPEGGIELLSDVDVQLQLEQGETDADLFFVTDEEGTALNDILNHLTRLGITIERIQSETPTLEEAFQEVIQEGFV